MHLTDAEISALLSERKPMIDAAGFLRTFMGSPIKDGHRRLSTSAHGDGGSNFLLAVRQSVHDPYDFSVILTYVASDGANVNLRRHNGPTHAHRNPIEGTDFVGRFHAHIATERTKAGGSRRSTTPSRRRRSRISDRRWTRCSGSPISGRRLS